MYFVGGDLFPKTHIFGNPNPPLGRLHLCFSPYEVNPTIFFSARPFSSLPIHSTSSGAAILDRSFPQRSSGKVGGWLGVSRVVELEGCGACWQGEVGLQSPAGDWWNWQTQET